MTTRKTYPAKGPGERRRYGFNWTPRRLGTEQIITVNAVVTAGTIVLQDFDVMDVDNSLPGQGTTHVITGGAHGENASVQLTVTTDTGQILTQTVHHPIRNK